MNEENITKMHQLHVRLTDEEKKMLDELKQSPHFINVAEYIRATIRHLYQSKVKKETK